MNTKINCIYSEYKKKVDHIVKAAERDHYNNILLTHKNNLNKTWKIIKEVINKNKRPRIQDSFVLNGHTITSKVDISEKCNDFFVNIGPTLKNRIPSCTGKVSDYIKRVQNSIFLRPVTETEIGKIVKNIKDGSPGWDEISPTVFKLCLSHM